MVISLDFTKKDSFVDINEIRKKVSVDEKLFSAFINEKEFYAKFGIFCLFLKNS